MTCSHPELGHRHPQLAQRPWSHPKCGHRHPLVGRHPLAGTDIPGGHRGRGLTPSAGTDTPGWHRGHGLTPSAGTDTPRWHRGHGLTPSAGTDTPGWHRSRGLTPSAGTDTPQRADIPWLAQTTPVGIEAMVSPRVWAQTPPGGQTSPGWYRHPWLAQRPWSHPECGHRHLPAGRHALAGTDTPGGHRDRGLTPWLAQTPLVGTEAMASPTQVLPSSPGTWGSLHSHWKPPLVFLHRADVWQGGSTSSSHSLMSAHTMGGQCPASAPLPRRPAPPQSCL